MNVSIAKRSPQSEQQEFREPVLSGTITLRQEPASHIGLALVLKRVVDVVISAALLLVLSPVLAGAALAIKLTSTGPVFFRQRRYGFNNDHFTILKLRTMFAHDADMSGVNQTRLEIHG